MAFQTGKKKELCEFDLILATTAVFLKMNLSVLRTMILQGQIKDPSQYNAESEFPGIEPEAVNSAGICFFEEVQKAVLTQFYVMIIFECVLNYGVLEEIFSALLVWLGSFFF